MNEPQEAVNATESAPVEKEQVVNEQTEQTAPETTEQVTNEQQQEETPAQGNVQPQYEAVDEYGVPYKNRYMEAQRKLQELPERIPQIIEDTLAKRQAPQEVEYSISQLEQFALDNPNQRPWVEEQKAKIVEKRTIKATQEQIKASESKREGELKRQQSFQYVAANYPEIFTVDPYGNRVFNNQHPLTQQIGQIMQDPRFANDPEGLVAAADMAAGRLARMQQMQSANKNKLLKRQVKKLQNTTLVEGNGQAVQQESNSPLKKARQLLSQTGSKDALQAYTKELLKARGVI